MSNRIRTPHPLLHTRTPWHAQVTDQTGAVSSRYSEEQLIVLPNSVRWDFPPGVNTASVVTGYSSTLPQEEGIKHKCCSTLSEILLQAFALPWFLVLSFSSISISEHWLTFFLPHSTEKASKQCTSFFFCLFLITRELWKESSRAVTTFKTFLFFIMGHCRGDPIKNYQLWKWESLLHF